MRPTYSGEKIKVKAMCLIVHGDKVLVQDGFDPDDGKHFYRVLGGHMDFRETAVAAVRREMMEELHAELKNLQFLQMVENIFTYSGVPGHEVIFLYKADFIDPHLYDQEVFIIKETDREFAARWVPVQDILDKKVILYPATDYQKLLG